jgi:dihydrofolate reductase
MPSYPEGPVPIGSDYVQMLKDRDPRILLSLIVAMDRNRLIGNGDALPWRYPADMKHFKEETWNKTCLMGSKTWYSIPEKFRPLERRNSLILSRSEEPGCRQSGHTGWTGVSKPSVYFFENLEDALVHSYTYYTSQPYVIGGTNLYQQVMDLVTHMVITRIDAEHEGDTYFPEFDASEWEVTKEVVGGRDGILKFQWLERKR